MAPRYQDESSNPRRLRILSEKQGEILALLVKEVRVNGSTYEYADIRFTNFSHSFYHLKKELDSSSDRHRKAKNILSDKLRNLNSDIVGLGDRELSSDFGFFCVDAGANSSMHPNYASLPGQYKKIERKLEGHPSLLAQFAQIKSTINDVLNSMGGVINIDYIRSLEAIQDLFLSTGFEAETFGLKTRNIGFFYKPSTFVNSPVHVETMVELGSRSSEILERCLQVIEPRITSPEGIAFVAAARAFSQAIQEKGLVSKFGELIELYQQLPPDLPDRN